MCYQTTSLTLSLRILYKKTPARKNSLELKVAQLKGEGTVTLHRHTEVCICHVENDRN